MNNTKEQATSAVISTQSLPARILAFIFLLLPPVLLVYFLSSPFPNTETPRLALLFQPLNDPEFVDAIWFGENLPDAPFTGERFLATALGFLVVFAAFCFGRFLIEPLSKIIDFGKREKIFFSTSVGLILFSSFFLYAGLFGAANLPFLTVALCVPGIAAFVVSNRKRRRNSAQTEKRTKRRLSFVSICQIVPAILFTSFYVLGATTPLFEYDAVEYHAQSFREIFESGKIAFFDHNVYANMPLGAETFYLVGFNLIRDLGFGAIDVLRLGSLVGKTILASFALLTALGIWASGKRFFSRDDAGLWGAILFLSFPCVFEVYSNGLNDGVSGAALFLAFYLFLLGITEKERVFGDRRTPLLWTIGLGVFAGYACSVKYTGVVFVLIPLFLELCAILWAPRLEFVFPKVKAKVDDARSEPFLLAAKTRVLALVLFLAATCVVCGGWYLRNAAATNNPVYPLACSVFGDKTKQWNESIQQRWNRAHSSAKFGAKALEDACFASLQNDLTSSPFFLWFVCFGAAFFSDLALAPKSNRESTSRAILFDREKSATFGVFVLVALFWFAWFLLTHRLVRFLVPITPLVATILGLFVAKGVSERSRVSQSILLCSVLVGLFFSGLLIDLLGVGRMAPLRALERDPMRFPQTSIYFNDRPELFESADESNERQKLLLVGEAKAFVYRVPLLYSTCWNDSPLIPTLEGNVERNDDGQIVGVSNAAQIVANLRKARVAYVLVDFSEIERFRSPGNYGFNDDDITERLFEILVQSGVLTPFTPKELQNVGDKVKIYQVCSQSR